ncbi:MAG: U32 family peptidase [Lachnospiraceae bacterium]|nr:U32 family peptidase [Lachnospiraceae bacterium]
MEKKKVELLAPAGNYQAFVGAINAGADAVYLGGDKFSARAYADNFTTDEICKALRYAHFNGKKIYLTLNTLVKETEFSLLYDFVRPFYEAGLDGIIIQDLGVWQYIREIFPGMPLHASTQMTITGMMGADFLKENGASRIVPARELSLEEIKKIKERTGLELECFIHGAMCYCYSGQCLFSSILGGRSGNRGRCAQPCRLSYSVSDTDTGAVSGEIYPLSLKDMCTIEYVPKLIEAGIDSFKIEGRMKRPEYAAGVTAVYRKYIDRYYEKGMEEYHVNKSDMDRLKKLYIRSELQTGYYERNNGREMVTLNKPGYIGSDETLIQDIAKQYLQDEKKQPAKMSGTFRVGEAAMLRIEGNGITQVSYGEEVQRALSTPMEKEKFLKQLRKTGNSFVYIDKEEIEVDKDAFMPVAQLNNLRREAIEAFEDKVIASHDVEHKRETCTDSLIYKYKCNYALKDALNDGKASDSMHQSPQIHITVKSMEQLHIVCQYSCDRLYIDSDLYIEEFDRISQYLYTYGKNAIYLALPYVIREKDLQYLKKLHRLLNNVIKGFLVRNLESLFWVFSLHGNYDIVTDTGIYCFNAETVRFLGRYSVECYLPYELNEKECRKLTNAYRDKADDREQQKISMTVYGTIPMMITANCVKKTTSSCQKSACCHLLYLTDRYNKRFPVLCNCRHCYNIIYNSVPYSLHMKKKELLKLGLFAIRLDFVSETETEIKDILEYYFDKKEVFPVTEYTTGHYKRGIN